MIRRNPSCISIVAAAALACFAPRAGAIGNSDLLLHYDFEHLYTTTDANNVTTTMMPDVSGHGADGKFVDVGNGGGPSNQAKFGAGAFQLSAVQTPDSFSLPDAFSIAMWVKFPQGDSLPNNIQMLATNSNGGSATDGFRYYLNTYNTNDGVVRLETGNGSAGANMGYYSTVNYTNPDKPTKPNPPTDGQYHLFVMTYTANDPALGEPHAFSWYDDYYLADGHPSNAGSLQPDFQKNGPLRFGGTLDNAFAPGGVQIDDVRIYHGVLGESDILKLMNPAALLPGDANGDGTVDTNDFAILAANFTDSGRAVETGDFNGDGIVNALDFNILATNFGATSPAPALSGTVVPEPATIGTSLLLLAFAGRRRCSRK